MVNMVNVEGFDEKSAEKLAHIVNAWLDENEDVEIIDIKLSTDSSGGRHTSALVIYQRM